MRKKVVVLDGGYASYHYEKMLFTKSGFEFKVYNGSASDTLAKINLAKNAQGILIRGTLVDAAFLDQLKDLKAIVRYGVGYDNINIEAATARKIRVSNVQGYGNHAVSDHALALMYACSRSLIKGNQKFKTGFGAAPIEPVYEFHRKTLGIVGLGRIGSSLSIKARNLFANIIACDPYVSQESCLSVGAKKVNFEELLQQSHVISIHCNLNKETLHMFDQKAFDLCKNKPVLINTSRGPVIREQDLLEALNQNKLHSAGLDVFEQEPPGADQDSLFHHPDVICTGHYAWYSENSHLELQKRAADNLLGLLRGELPEDCLNP
ncbi:MAG: C-terminal binding protein [Candidatus Cyclobacteriaceae bacterium M3_2C_046]